MKNFWSRGTEDGLGDELSARRPEPRAEFVHSLAQRIEAEGERVHRRSFRPVFAASFTALLVVAFGVFGGAGYASSMKHQVADVAHVFNFSHETPSAPASAPNANVSAQNNDNQSNDNSSNTALGSSSSSGQSANGHHGGGDGDDEGDDDDQYRPGHGCGDRHHVHDDHNDCHGHHHHHGR